MEIVLRVKQGKMAQKKPGQGRINHFLLGFSSAFDISGMTFIKKNNDELSGFQKDYFAMHQDWENLGNDMRKVIIREKPMEKKAVYGR